MKSSIAYCAALTAELILLSVVQAAPLHAGAEKPLLLLAAAASLGCAGDELTAAVFGSACGIAADALAGFPCFYAAALPLSALTAARLTELRLCRNALTALVLIAAISAAVIAADCLLRGGAFFPSCALRFLTTVPCAEGLYFFNRFLRKITGRD